MLRFFVLTISFLPLIIFFQNCGSDFQSRNTALPIGGPNQNIVEEEQDFHQHDLSEEELENEITKIFSSQETNNDPLVPRVIKINFAYTSAGAQTAGGFIQLNNRAISAVDQMNLAFERNKLNLLAEVGVIQSAGGFRECGGEGDCYSLYALLRMMIDNNREGFFNLPSGGDHTVLVVGTDHPMFNGYAESPGRYIVIRGNKLDDNYILAHEFGHNLGLAHGSQFFPDGSTQIMNPGGPGGAPPRSKYTDANAGFICQRLGVCL